MPCFLDAISAVNLEVFRNLCSIDTSDVQENSSFMMSNIGLFYTTKLH